MVNSTHCPYYVAFEYVVVALRQLVGVEGGDAIGHGGLVKGGIWISVGTGAVEILGEEWEIEESVVVAEG
jgi:hypothetical protein